MIKFFYNATLDSSGEISSLAIITRRSEYLQLRVVPGLSCGIDLVNWGPRGKHVVGDVSSKCLSLVLNIWTYQIVKGDWTPTFTDFDVETIDDERLEVHWFSNNRLVDLLRPITVNRVGNKNLFGKLFAHEPIYPNTYIRVLDMRTFPEYTLPDIPPTYIPHSLHKALTIVIKDYNSFTKRNGEMDYPNG